VKSVKLSLLAVFGVLFLAACAQSGQVLKLSPKADVTESRGGAGTEVAVRAVDKRPNRALGRLENPRGGEEGLLASAQDLERVMTNAAMEALSRKGFKPVPWSPDARRKLTLEIVTLDHIVGGVVPRKVSTEVELGFVAVFRDNTLTGNARHSQGDTVAFRPSPEENAEWINRGLDATLERLMVERLVNFLSQD